MVTDVSKSRNKCHFIVAKCSGKVNHSAATRSSLEDEAGADLMRSTLGRNIVELLRVESKTE